MEPSYLLHDATVKLKRGELKAAIDLVAKARKDIQSHLQFKSLGSSEHDTLVQLTYLLNCAALQYFIRSKEEEISSDDTSKLCHLCLSLGICNILDTLFLPLAGTRSKLEHEIREFSWLRRFSEGLKQEIDETVKQVLEDIRSRKLEGSKEGLDQSIKKIVDSVNPSAEEVRNLAASLGRRFEAGDFKQARKLYEYVRDEIQYIYDPFGMEEIQKPELTLKLRSGDCEDQAILLASLLLAVGFKPALLFADADNDGLPDHVYTAVYLPRAPDYTKPFARKKTGDGKDLHDWVPLDPSAPDADFGVIPIGNLQISKFVSFPRRKQEN